MLSQKNVPIQPETYQKIECYAKDCIPTKTVTDVVNELIEIGIDTLNVQLKAQFLLQPNPNAH